MTCSCIRGVTCSIEAEGRVASAGSLRDPFPEILQNGACVGYGEDGGYGLNARYVFTPLVSDAYTFEISSAVVATGSYRLSMYEDDDRGSVEGVGRAGSSATRATGWRPKSTILATGTSFPPS